MTISVNLFNVEVFEEHVEDAGFLFEQRLAYLHDPELSWLDLADWEARIDAHLDALVVGEQLALRTCARRAADAEPGELNAALRVFCRQGRRDLAFNVLNLVEAGDPDQTLAAAHALRHEMPTAWQDDVFRFFQGKNVELDGVLAHVIGYRRFDAAALLEQRLAAAPAIGAAEMAWALGRVGTQNSLRALRPHLHADDAELRGAACLALARLGDATPVRSSLLAAHTEVPARRLLGVAGDQQSVNALLDILRGNNADPQCVRALGLLGDLRAVAPLVELLADDMLGAAAATALNIITGAGLEGEFFLEDRVEADELLDEELEKFREQGVLPTRHDGEPFGVWQTGPSRDTDAWRQWLTENRNRFDRSKRWRLGQPYGPVALVECLKSRATPNVIRSATVDELVVRYQLPVPFEFDLPVHQQAQFLNNMTLWAAACADEFQAGAWYFAGQPQ